MAERARQKETFFEMQEDETLSAEHLDNQVQKAQEQLVHLKRQQEQIEKQKRELEELSRRQEQLQQGKAEMIEKFTRALVVLERETHDAQKRVEQLHAIHHSYIQHLDVLEAINPKSWENMDINKELSKALSAVDDSRAEYSKSRSKISAEPAAESAEPAAGGVYEDGAAGAEKDFTYWLKCGFAFTLPLLVLLLLGIAAMLYRFSNP